MTAHRRGHLAAIAYGALLTLAFCAGFFCAVVMG